MAKHEFPQRNFDPGSLLGTLAVSFGLWIIVGALGYSDWPKSVSKDTNGLVSCLIFPSFFFALFFASSECYFHPSLSSAALFSAAVLGGSAATAFCILTSGWRNHYHCAFWIMGGVFVGCGLEIVTRLLTACVHRLETWGVDDLRGKTRLDADQEHPKRV